MCARYTLTRAEKEVAKMYNVQLAGPFQPNYNLAPTQEGLVRSFTIMTTQANRTVCKVHDPKFRMPVILDKFREQFWLAKEIAPSDLLGLCKPYPDEKMIAYPVSTTVNSAVIKGAINNSPELILPINSQ